MRINNNITALNANNKLASNTLNLGKSVEKLSSGLRINRAGDDGAGLAISEKLRAQVRGLNQASKNAQDGISLLQTAEGALNETSAILQRMRELSVQSANDTLITADRAVIQDEVNHLVAEIDDIATRTQFNTQELIDGSYSGKLFHIGANSNQSLAVSDEQGGTAISDMQSAALGVDALNLETQTGADDAIETIDGAIDAVNATRAGLGALTNRLENKINNLTTTSENTSAAESRIRDVDMAKEMMNFTKNNILTQAAQSMLAQANQIPQGVLQLLR